MILFSGLLPIFLFYFCLLNSFCVWENKAYNNFKEVISISWERNGSFISHTSFISTNATPIGLRKKEFTGSLKEVAQLDESFVTATLLLVFISSHSSVVSAGIQSSFCFNARRPRRAKKSAKLVMCHTRANIWSVACKHLLGHGGPYSSNQIIEANNSQRSDAGNIRSRNLKPRIWSYLLTSRGSVSFSYLCFIHRKE